METPIKIFGNTHMEKNINFQLHQKNNVVFSRCPVIHPFCLLVTRLVTRRVMSDQVVEVVDMDPDIDEFNEDVEIPKDLDCPVLPRRASVWFGRIGRSGIAAIFHNM